MFDQHQFLTEIDIIGVGTGQNVPPPTIPVAPSDFVAEGDSDSLPLSWTNNDTYSAIVIDRKATGNTTSGATGTATDYAQLASISGSLTTYDDTTAVVDTYYTYKIKGVKATYPSPYSNESTSFWFNVVENVANFPGTDSTYYLSITNDTRFKPGTDFSIVGFIRPTFLAEVNTLRAIFGKGTYNVLDASTFSCSLHYSLVANKLIYTHSDATNFTTLQTTGSLTNNTWVFFSLTYKVSTTTASLTLNRGTAVTNTSMSALNAITADLRLGGVDRTLYNSWKGQISSFGMWNKVLSAAELNEIYNSGVALPFFSLQSGTRGNCLYYWQLDDYSAGTANVNRFDEIEINDLVDTVKIPSATNVPA